MRVCGGREFVIGGLLYSTILSGSPAGTRHALIAGATVDALDFILTLVSWKVTGELDGMPAGMVSMCAGINLLIGAWCWRALAAGKVRRM